MYSSDSNTFLKNTVNMFSPSVNKEAKYNFTAEYFNISHLKTEIWKPTELQFKYKPKFSDTLSINPFTAIYADSGYLNANFVTIPKKVDDILSLCNFDTKIIDTNYEYLETSSYILAETPVSLRDYKEQDSRVIVCLTEYMPDYISEASDIILVYKTESFLHHEIRIDNNVFDILHFKNWNDYSVANSGEIVNFILYVKWIHESYNKLSKKKNKKPNLTIHCRAGVGRTGTFTVLYHLISFMDPKIYLDDSIIFKNIINIIISLIRHLRIYIMVQTEKQYMMIYDTMLYYLQKKNNTPKHNITDFIYKNLIKNSIVKSQPIKIKFLGSDNIHNAIIFKRIKKIIKTYTNEEINKKTPITKILEYLTIIGTSNPDLLNSSTYNNVLTIAKNQIKKENSK